MDITAGAAQTAVCSRSPKKKRHKKRRQKARAAAIPIKASDDITEVSGISDDGASDISLEFNVVNMGSNSDQGTD